MKIRCLPYAFSICKLPFDAAIPFGKEPYTFLSRTESELSLVCKTEEVPSLILSREGGWKGFFIEGSLDFSLVGILSEISGILAREGTAIFALSTYDTDYIFVKEERFEDACEALRAAGHIVR